MRIVLVVEDFGGIGGIQEVVDNLAAELLRLGHEVVVISTLYQHPGCERAPRAGVECVYLDVPRYHPPTWRHLERLVRHSHGLRELASRVRQLRPDIVNSHVWDWDRFQTVATACAIAGVPLAQTLHDSWGRYKLGNRALRALSQASAVTAVSAATRDYFQTFSAAARNARVITNGVDYKAAEAAARYRRERPYIFCTARLDLRHKAIDVLVSSFKSVAAWYPEVDLLIGGDGPDRGLLEAQIAAAGLEKRVELLGVCPRGELWGLYKAALLFAMPSRLPEGLGLVFLEAMACGTPVIGTNSGGTPEIVLHGKSGLLIERNEPEELAGAIKRLLDDPQARAEMGRRGRKFAAEYTWPRIAGSYLEVYASCLGRQAPAQG